MYPRIIQGGMGVGVSGWPLARAVAQTGQLGVVSGTALAVMLARRLQCGDVGGYIRRALERFPSPAIAERILNRYYIAGGKAPDQRYASPPLPGVQLEQSLTELTVAANFAEVFLAKEGHSGAVGVNYLEKVQFPTLASLYGAMLAGVDYVLMGAGIPRFIPGVLDAFSRGEAAELRIDVAGMPAGESVSSRLDPAAMMGAAPALKRPRFLAIVASATLAATLARKSNGRVDGFVIEGPTAGGHNAPPRGETQHNARGEPIYGERDRPDLERFAALGLPFWLAGGYGEPGRLADALTVGAAGVQVGTAFAFCDESSLDPAVKRRVLDAARSGGLDVYTDPNASPTGFPFKVLRLEGTLSEAARYGERTRGCDLGYLRTPYRREDGTIGYRCAAEPVNAYLAKGGAEADTAGRVCLCNALSAAIGYGQVRADGSVETPIFTAGESVRHIGQFLAEDQHSYTAADVVRRLLA